MFYNYVSLVIAIISLGIGALMAGWILRKETGDEKMRSIAEAIKIGANAFLKRQYMTIGLIATLIAVGLLLAYASAGNWSTGWRTAGAFLLGAISSAVSGIVGMSVAVRSNVRSAAAAKKGMNDALVVALRAGAVSGITIVSLSLLGIAGLFLIYTRLGYEAVKIPSLIVGYGFGASLVALFAQLGGGIYTKAADVGADLVGKIEANIPEDDPRNPAVVADLVGDNVGDCAGRGADLFESTAAENIGAMLLGAALFPVFGVSGVLFPLVVRSLGLGASIAGIVSVRAREDEDPMKALTRGYWVTTVLAAGALFAATRLLLASHWIWFFGAGLVGLANSVAFIYLTQYYTEARYRPVRNIAEASKTGHATNIIYGFSVGLESTAITVVTISLALLAAFKLGSLSGIPGGGLYGTAVATMGMLATAAYILAMDTFGPIVDNGGGIIEMSGAPEAIRRNTDKLDSAGNTTKALTKGYAVGSAALAAFLLFSAYLEEAHLTIVDLAKVQVFAAAMIGAMLVFLFSSLAIRAVGKAAYYIINEVRRQFKEHPGIMTGSEKPDYSRAIDITTRGALKEMVAPGLLAVGVPILVGVLFKAEAAAGLLMVGTIAGILLATVMNNGGGAWDNAKKWIEAGNLGGKGSEAHKASITGDTVGDPLKDTAGPSLHVLVKLLSTLTLALVSLFR